MLDAQQGYGVFNHLRQILIHELPIDSERVNLYNQKFVIPTDEAWYIVIERGPSKMISSRNTLVDLGAGQGLQEVMDLNTQDQYTIGVFSRNLDALNRKEEIIMALGSVYAQQIQEKYSFRIFKNPSLTDLSELEGAALLYRFDISVIVHSWRQKVKDADFYDAFSAQVRVNDGSPDMVVEFQQPTTEYP